MVMAASSSKPGSGTLLRLMPKSKPDMPDMVDMRSGLVSESKSKTRLLVALVVDWFADLDGGGGGEDECERAGRELGKENESWEIGRRRRWI